MNDPTATACDCERPVFPVVISNLPGLSRVAYRCGEYVGFRAALLEARDGEVELPLWHPAPGDLGLQLVEWWAYLSDVLTFYNEQWANNAYLGTAFHRGAVERMVQLLGYRPRPGIGAKGTLAAILAPTTSGTVTIPVGFAVQSKPLPGHPPQIFELDSSKDVVLREVTAPAVVPIPVPTSSSTPSDVLLAGSISGLKPGDLLLVSTQNSPSSTNSYYGTTEAWAVLVQRVTYEKDPEGRTNTRVWFTAPIGSAMDSPITSYAVYKPRQSIGVFPDGGYFVGDGNDPDPTHFHLSSIVRAIRPGDVVIAYTDLDPTIELGFPYTAAGVLSNADVVWYMNTPPTSPVVSPTSLAGTVKLTKDSAGITFSAAQTIGTNTPIAFSSQPGVLYFLQSAIQGASAATLAGNYEGPNADAATATLPNVGPPAPPLPHSMLVLDTPFTDPNFAPSIVHYNFRLVGNIIADPVRAIPPSSSPDFQPQDRWPGDVSTTTPVLVQDAAGNGMLTRVVPPGSPSAPVTFTDATPPDLSLVPPLDLFLALVPVSRGKTVQKEVLGTGDARVAGQVFTLQKSPLTYFPGSDPSFPASTLRVWVNGIEWTEVPSFYGQPPGAQVFVTRQTIDQQTNVIGGDGVNGARFPTGAVITASYRYGSGRESPPAGALTNILKPQPGLRALRNPVPVSGGDDPIPSDQVRRYGPQSVLTFGRAISASDYEAIAVQAPAVSRARAAFAWDPARQRALVNVYVGDDDGAVASARQALESARDQNLPAQVLAAIATDVTLSLTLLCDPRFDPAMVTQGVVAALTDPDTGLFSPRRMRIGAALYESQLVAACLSVAGAVAVHALTLVRTSDHSPVAGPRYQPDAGPGGFFTLDPSNLFLVAEADRG